MGVIGAMGFACLLFLTNRVVASPDTPSPETFRIRIMNGVHGPVELSIDRGKTWSLVGRIVKPAAERSSDGQSTLATVEQSSADGFAFGVGGRRTMKVLPESSSAMKNVGAMSVNIPAGSILFKEFLPTQGSVVQIVLNERPIPIPTDYALEDNDRFVISVLKADSDKIKLALVLKQAEEHYRDQAIAKYKSAGRKPISGHLIVNANLAAGDTVGAVTFCVDGSVSAILNRTPYSFKLDTRKISNGEHLVEARALDTNGHVVTYKKLLVVVENL